MKPLFEAHKLEPGADRPEAVRFGDLEAPVVGVDYDGSVIVEASLEFGQMAGWTRRFDLEGQRLDALRLLDDAAAVASRAEADRLAKEAADALAAETRLEG